jgi:hypothetical protein
MARKKQPTRVLGSDARSEALRAQPKEALVALVRVLAPSAISPRRRLRSLRSRQPCVVRTKVLSNTPVLPAARMPVPGADASLAAKE